MHSSTSDTRTRAWSSYKPRTAVMNTLDDQERAYLISSTQERQGEAHINSILLIPPLLTQPSLRNTLCPAPLGRIAQSMYQVIPRSTRTEVLPCREHKLWFVCVPLFEGCELGLSVSLTVEMDDELTFVVWSSSWSDDIRASSWGPAVSLTVSYRCWI